MFTDTLLAQMTQSDRLGNVTVTKLTSIFGSSLTMKSATLDSDSGDENDIHNTFLMNKATIVPHNGQNEGGIP